MKGDSAAADSDLRTLDAQLGDSDKRVQRRAAEVLAGLVAERREVAERIDDALASADPRRRWGAAFCQARAGRVTPAAVAIWIDHLASSDRDLRWAAHALLVEHAGPCGDTAFDGLRSAATDVDPQRRKMALYCLRDVGVAAAETEALVASALDAQELETRLAALAAYPAVAVDVERAALRIATCLQDGDARVRRAAAAALGKLPWTDTRVREALQRAANAPDPALRRAAAGALTRRG